MNISRRGIEKSKERRSVEYSIVGCKVTTAFIISSECVEGKVYNEKIQFAQMIIQDIDTTRTSIVEFLCISRQRWHARKQT
jgi:hypothetical protein